MFSTSHAKESGEHLSRVFFTRPIGAAGDVIGGETCTGIFYNKGNIDMAISKEDVTRIALKMMREFAAKQNEFSEFNDLRSAQRMHERINTCQELLAAIDELEEKRKSAQGFEVMDLEIEGF